MKNMTQPQVVKYLESFDFRVSHYYDDGDIQMVWMRNGSMRLACVSPDGEINAQAMQTNADIDAWLN